MLSGAQVMMPCGEGGLASAGFVRQAVERGGGGKTDSQLAV
jgi:hypothetical protein